MDNTADTISFIFNDGEKVLAMTKITDDGDFLKRESKDWTRVSDDDGHIYDQNIVDVAPDNIDNAIKTFDAEPAGLVKDDVKAFLAPVQ